MNIAKRILEEVEEIDYIDFLLNKHSDYFNYETKQGIDSSEKFINSLSDVGDQKYLREHERIAQQIVDTIHRYASIDDYRAGRGDEVIS